VLGAAEQDPEATPTVAAAAHLGSAVAMLLSGDDVKGAVEADLAAEEAERIGLPWLARTGRAALALSGREDGRDEAATARAVAEREGDAWGYGLASLLGGWGSLQAATPNEGALEEAVLEFRRLGATVLEAWARGAHALQLARAGAAAARDEAAQAELTARSAGVRAALGCTYLALAELQGRDGAEYRALAASLAEESALALPGPAGAVDANVEPPVEVRCFGGFGMFVDGVSLELTRAKPRTRQLLRLLAINAGRSVHREVLMAALWPEADRDTSTRNLHVAVSSLRRALEPGVARGEPSMIVRDGDAYRLNLPSGSRVDLVEFDEALTEARAMRRRPEKAAAAYTRALDIYGGDLLPEDGPAEWVVNERDRRRDEFTESASAVAVAHIDRGDPVAAALACERGLHADQYNDTLWRLCASAYEQAGDAAAAARARQKYERILNDLGVSPIDALRA
jgi:DNA-binding SARP family transcriptional activator